MQLEAVTVCVNYADFLRVVIPWNIPHFNRWVIVTSPSDQETRELCRQYSLECILSEDGTRDGEFAKGRLIERGLQHLSADGWRLHIDGDIALPHRAIDLLEAAHLDEACIYGCDRIMVRSAEEWQKLVASGWLTGGQHDYHNRVRFVKDISVGSRWADLRGGYVPIGFFQLWHSSEDQYHGTRIKPYPVKHNNACRTDVQHALQWDRRKRLLLPELVVAHIESQQAKLGANWNGRTTQRFGAADPSQAAVS